MLKEVFLSWYGYYSGGDVGNIIYQWQEAGIFAYLLPFLLIFALVYGILDKSKMFDSNKAINPIIGLVVGLLSLQFDLVPEFFSVIFPKLGVGLAILLMVLILLGIFSPGQSWVIYTFFGIAAVILIAVLVYSAGDLGWSAGYWWQDNWPTVVGAVFILALIGIIVGASQTPLGIKETAPKWMKDMFDLK